MERVRVAVRHDYCIGTGNCAQVAPQVFSLDDDGIAHVKCEFPAAELQESVEDAEAMCPTDAIEVTREAGA